MTVFLKKQFKEYLGLEQSHLEVERAWARARRPVPKFWLTVNKPQARGSASLVFQKAQSMLELEF